MQLTDQKKGTLLAFIAIMFITPDSLLIRLSSIESWGLIFYRGIIPFFAVFIGLLNIFFKFSIISNLNRSLSFLYKLNILISSL